LIATLDPNFLPIRNWPALGVAIIVTAYWWRVVRMAAKMRRKTGRGANFIPAEPTGRLLRVLWQPVVGLWIVLPWYAALSTGRFALFQPLIASVPLRWTGLILAAAAYAATRVCWNRMGKSWRMGIDPGEITALVVTGPYAFVRHPIYGLSTVLMAATVAAVTTPLMIFVALVHAGLLQWEARREERHLSRIHGSIYDEYRRRTGQFLPRFSAFAPSPGTPGEGRDEDVFGFREPLDARDHPKPNPNPLPAYRERGPETSPPDRVSPTP
jgi:protein-S-isoprenylcysteine O-methyltransferase Ste14